MAQPLKDQFDREVVELLAERFSRWSSEFPADDFRSTMLDAFPELELKERINLVADYLAAVLPNDYASAIAIIVEVAESGVEGFAAWPLCSFIERHGVDFPEDSLTAMSTVTKQFSCEFAIRPFLATHLDLTREYLRRWTVDEHEMVRRLSSEGTRPLLPWAPRVAALLEDPQIGVELLFMLRHDESGTVRRSVANHLNDLAKAQPDLVVALLDGWTSESSPVNPAMVRHALRTLVKQGHQGALGLRGFTTAPQVEVNGFSCAPEALKLGSEIEITVEVTATAQQPQRLVVDFLVHHVNASGKTSPKVFKWTTLDLAPGEAARLVKRRRIATATTRRYHAGFHRIDLQIAGHTFGTTGFDLTESST
jgi:3-methyladenine DNA glycosylase AlkC